MSSSRGEVRSPIFVVAYAHSGTGMLRDALSMSPDVFGCQGETKYFQNLGLVRAAFPDLRTAVARAELVQYVAYVAGPQYMNPAPVPVDERQLSESVAMAIAEAPADHIGVFVNTLDHLAAEAGKRTWLEKTPAHIFEIDVITGALPEARFVEVVRSPWGALGSKKTRQEIAAAVPGDDPHRKRDRFFHPLWDALAWRAAVQTGAQAKDRLGDRFVRVTYEAITKDPEAQLQSLCDAIGVTYVPEMLGVRRGNAVGPGAKVAGITQASVNHWQATLSPGEIGIISVVAGNTAKGVGFDAPRGGLDRTTLSWAARTAADPIVRARAEAKRTNWRAAARSLSRYAKRVFSR
jgi:hypothetical protein